MVRLPLLRPRGRPNGGGRRRNDGSSAASPRPRVLVVDGDDETASRAVDLLLWEGFDVVRDPAAPPTTADDAGNFDVVVVDPAGVDPVTLLEQFRVRAATAEAEIVFASARNDVDAAVGALHRGASDWLVKPVAAGRLRLAVGRALERRRLLGENRRLRRDLDLFTGAQRLLETLDLTRLAVVAVDVLTAVPGIAAAAVWGPGARSARGLNEDELAALVKRPRPTGLVDDAHGDDVGLPRFGWGRFIDVGDGLTAAVLGSAAVVGDDDDALGFLGRQLTNAVDHCRRLQHATEQALRDPLTGMWNANAFADAVESAIAARGAPFAVLFIDIDHFKSVNDVHGHLVGSAVIVDIARAIGDAVRADDVVARYGGDEFTVLLTGADVDDAARVAERVRRRVAALEPGCAPTLRVTISVGVAGWPRHGTTTKELVAAADGAMYRSKAASRNRVCIAGPVADPS